MINQRGLWEAEEQMRAIAAKHKLGMQHLRGKSRLREHVLARVECYRLLLTRGWNLGRIGVYFNRRRDSVWRMLDGAVRIRRSQYMKQYYRRQRGAGKPSGEGENNALT